MTRHAAIFASALLIASTASAQQPDSAGPTRPLMTIADLETNRTGWVPPPRLGSTLAEMLTDRLVASGKFRIVDRASIADDVGAIPSGMLRDRARDAGVAYILVGAVTRFSNEKHQSGGGGFLPIPFAGLFHKTKVESVIGLVLRVIDVRTGEVVATASAEGGSSDSHTSGGGLAVVGHVPLPIGGAGGSSATGVQDRLLDVAAQDAVGQAANQIIAAAERIGRDGGK